MCGTSHTSSAEPVLRTRSRKVGLDRFDLTIPRHNKYTNKRLAIENINAHNKHVAFYSSNTSTHRSSSDTTKGFRSIVNQKFLRMRTGKPRSNLGDASMRGIDEIFIPLKKSHSGNVQQNVVGVVVLAFSSSRSDPIQRRKWRRLREMHMYGTSTSPPSSVQQVGWSVEGVSQPLNNIRWSPCVYNASPWINS